MIRLLALLLLIPFIHPDLLHADNPDSGMPLRALAIAAPNQTTYEDFLQFIQKDLSSAGYNTLILRVDYGYEYTSHPELIAEGALSKLQVKTLADTCKEAGIEIIPQINLLGHQSWASDLGKLLEVYPELDETPNIPLYEEHHWPNEHGLYCKSYCPQHPDVHQVVFALVDELMNAFGATKFHAGMDEVFYIAHPDCERCAGEDPAHLFAGEVTRISNHLAEKGWELWIWGDRLLDGHTTGLGMWEASENHTATAINSIPRNVVICDWHYERAEPTPAYFALQGFQVIPCVWNKAEVAENYIGQIQRLRAQSNPVLANRFPGVMATVWSPADVFLKKLAEDPEDGEVRCFKTLSTP